MHGFFSLDPDNNGQVLIRFEGSCDLLCEPEVQESVILAAQSQPTVIVNLSQCNYMNPEWVRLLARASNEARRNGNTLIIRGMSRSLQRLAKACDVRQHLRLERDKNAPPPLENTFDRLFEQYFGVVVLVVWLLTVAGVMSLFLCA